jgi:hypothetical protein
MHVRSIRSAAPRDPADAPIRQRRNDGPESVEPVNRVNDAAEKSAPGLPVLEAEIKSLRLLLAEAQASRDILQQEVDDLRRDRDHWQNVARSDGAQKPLPRTWFCGRATGG